MYIYIYICYGIKFLFELCKGGKIVPPPPLFHPKSSKMHLSFHIIESYHRIHLPHPLFSPSSPSSSLSSSFPPPAKCFSSSSHFFRIIASLAPKARTNRHASVSAIFHASTASRRSICNRPADFFLGGLFWLLCAAPSWRI